MSTLNIGVLKKIIEHIPDDYTVEFDDGTNTSAIDDKIEIDVTLKKLVLKGY